jgi:hypothetical protein
MSAMRFHATRIEQNSVTFVKTLVEEAVSRLCVKSKQAADS